MLAFQAEVVCVDGTWRFEVASFPSPHLVMARAELFLSRHDFSYNVRTDSAGKGNTQTAGLQPFPTVPQRGAGWGRMGEGLQSGLWRAFKKKVE